MKKFSRKHKKELKVVKTFLSEVADAKLAKIKVAMKSYYNREPTADEYRGLVLLKQKTGSDATTVEVLVVDGFAIGRVVVLFGKNGEDTKIGYEGFENKVPFDEFLEAAKKPSK